MDSRIIFITGTDTGVGKTMLTALMLCYLRGKGAHALALKPFCSGGRQDAELLHELQDGELTLDEVNPFYFPEPVAPLVSARQHKRGIPLNSVVQHIRTIAKRLSAPVSSKPSTQNSNLTTHNFLLIEGSGGLLVPLGENYTVRDLIARLNCEVIVVSRNKLGTINHTLLTLEALSLPALDKPKTGRRLTGAPRARSIRCLLMDFRARDVSTRSNRGILKELVHPIPLVSLPFLGQNCGSPSSLKKSAKKFQKTLAPLFL